MKKTIYILGHSLRQLLLLFCVAATSSLYTQTINLGGTDVDWQTRSSFGGQLGYSRLKSNQFDLGINYYWSRMKHYPNGQKDDTYHTFGPSLSGIILLNNNVPSIGTQIGINYHYYYSICPRAQLTFEDYRNQDQRLGIDIGLSVLGLYPYIGYHHPIGKIETSEITRFRFGCKYIF